MRLYIDDIFVKLSAEQEQILQAAGYEVQRRSQQSCNDPHVIVASRPDVLLPLKKHPHLKWVQLTSAGYDFLKNEPLSVPISNARGVYSFAIGQYVLSRLLYVYQDMPAILAAQQDKQWYNRPNITSLEHLKVLIVGSGSIGQEIARCLQPFNMRIDGLNRSGKSVTYFDDCFPLSQLDEKLAHYDIIILALPLNEDTHHIIKEAQLRKMKASAILVNIGRGGLLSEKDLENCLDDHLRAVILDVFEHEPLPLDSKLWHHPKMLISAHTSYRNQLLEKQLSCFLVDNCLRFIHKEEVKNIINK